MKSRKVLIIAEAGVNHNGSIKLAKKLIDVAVKAKADIVKFQTFKAENLVTKNAKKANYQKQKNCKNTALPTATPNHARSAPRFVNGPGWVVL